MIPTRHLVPPLALVLGLAPCACQSAPTAAELALLAETAGVVYPETPRGEVVDDYHGTPVADPYRWLEQVDSEETRTWIEAQNELTESILAAIPEREAIRQRVDALWTYERYGLPTKEGGWYYMTYDDGAMSQPQIVRVPAMGRRGHDVVLDPNTFSEDGTVSLGGTSWSRGGRYLAYGLSDGGSDWRTWRVRDLERGEDLEDVIEWSRFSTPTWNPDDSGFWYGRYPQPPAGENKLLAAAGAQSVWYHRLGTPQGEDVLVHEDPDNPMRAFGMVVTDDDRFLVMIVREGTQRMNRLWVRELAAGDEAPWIRVFDDFDAQYYPLGNDGWNFYIRTDKDAPKGRIVRVDCSRPANPLEGPLENPLEEVVGEGEHALTSAAMIGGRLIVHYLVDALSEVRLFEQGGQEVGRVPLPGPGTARGFGGRQTDHETFFSFGSYTTPSATYRLDPHSGEVSVVWRPRVPFDPAAYETRQVFYESADGTPIPLFVTQHRDLDPALPRPTLLYGYGGFNIPMRPGFSPAVAAWLELGGTYAVACLRGGGEYGREWHLAGTKERKQNVFDDFIAAAEHLLSEGVTTPAQLAILGGSNGGLLVGACLNQRPELFGAALPAVGVMDMLRYHLFTIGRAWASDYGRSDDPEMFPHLLAYSPYQNVREGATYPATLITTADHDDRVVPCHSFKYAAALQHAQAGEDPLLIRIETRAGHGAGKSREQAVAEVADRWAFLVAQLGMEIDG